MAAIFENTSVPTKTCCKTKSLKHSIDLFLFVFLAALEFELRASQFLGRCSYCLSHSTRQNTASKWTFKKPSSWVPVTHACNSTYSEDRNQEDPGSRQPGQIIHKTLSRKNMSQKRAGGVAQGLCPEFTKHILQNTV
jgi:hypothetical protein